MSRRKRNITGVDLNDDARYQAYQRHLKLQGLAEKTRQSYERAFRVALHYFGDSLEQADREALSNYFNFRLSKKSSSTVSIDVCALKFYFCHVTQTTWHGAGLFKMTRAQRLPDVVTIDEVQRIINGTDCISYRVFYFTIYSLGLRLSEGLKLQIRDIDAQRQRVHVRRSKGCKDRLVPLAPQTLRVLRRFWSIHRNQRLLFPSRAGGMACSTLTQKPLDSSGVQKALHRVCEDVGLKKRSLRTVCVIATQPT